MVALYKAGDAGLTDGELLPLHGGRCLHIWETFRCDVKSVLRPGIVCGLLVTSIVQIILETHLGATLTSLPNSTSFWQATDVRSEVGDGGLEKREEMVDCGQNCIMGCLMHTHIGDT